jgi:hypothetical protein
VEDSIGDDAGRHDGVACDDADERGDADDVDGAVAARRRVRFDLGGGGE